jgi:selenocysteine lyase/cysteine desulfurase
VVGNEQEVPLVTGGQIRYVNLDYAASAPPLMEVSEAVAAMEPWCSSVHRGAGFKSQVSTAAYEGAREEVRAFLHTGLDDTVIFTRNTTDSINLLASCLALVVQRGQVLTPANVVATL